MRLNIVAKIGIIIGLLGGLIGVAAAISADPLGGSFVALIVIGSFGSVYWIFFRPMIQRSRLLKTGISAEGTVLKIWDTGVTINDNPQIGLLVEVRPQTGMPFQSETKLVISRLDVGAYQPGMTVNVRYDPKNQSKVAIENVTGGSGLALKQNYSPSEIKQMEEMLTKINNENTALMAYGESARAIVLKYMPMGINVNGNNPAVTLELEVLPDSRKSFKATAMGVIAEQSVAKFQPGEEIYVKFDPNDTSKVTIIHS
jgi:hypothetical protein